MALPVAPELNTAQPSAGPSSREQSWKLKAEGAEENVCFVWGLQIPGNKGGEVAELACSCLPSDQPGWSEE